MSLELNPKMPAYMTRSAIRTSRPSRRDIGVLFATLLMVSFVLQISFLGSPASIQETARIILEMDASATRLRQREQTLTEAANQKEADHSLSVAVSPPPSRPRVLLGIFSADFPNEEPCRHRQRRLLRIHPHACSLDKYLEEHTAECHLIYTFVLGGNPDAPSTELLDDKSRPWVLPSTAADNPRQYNGTDILAADVTLLNIKENMNDGKSQTWFSYAATLVDDHSIDYIAKQDTDTILYLDRFFDFVDTMLPPPPYNRNILAGSVVDKLWWGADRVHRQAPTEEWAVKRYGSLLHLYAAGQWYLMSPSLAKTVQQQALLGPSETSKYFAGHEDHDLSAMAFHSKQPIHLIIISIPQYHWLHNVKFSSRDDRWNQTWEKETNRMMRHVQTHFALQEDHLTYR